MKNKLKYVAILLIIGLTIINQTIYSQSAIGQLETISGQKINRNNSSSSTIDMNSMVTGMIAQSVIAAVFSSNNGSTPKIIEAKTQPPMMVLQLSGEQKRIQDALIFSKHKKLMDSYKLLDRDNNLQYKPISNYNIESKTIVNEAEKMKNQREFDFTNSTWVETQKELFKERIENPNKWADGIYNSLKTNAPPLPFKKFNEIEPGDILLIAPESDWENNPKDFLTGNAIKMADQFATDSKESNASHTVTFLKEENGVKKFMDNEPEKGPIIIDEKQFMEKYGKREMDVAHLKVAQPLNERQTDQIYKEALKLQQENEKGITEYGLTQGNMIVCSEASWVLIKSTGVLLPGTDFNLKQAIGVKISPADFYKMKQTFIVTPLSLGK